MAMSKASSTACKVACAWLLTALVIQNTFQNGVYIPVSAEEQDDIALQEWENGVTDLADRALENYISSSGNPELQASYYSTLLAVTAWKSSLEYQLQARQLILDDSTTIPAGGTYFGWYYYGNEPVSGTIFIYGQNGDPVALRSSIDRVIIFSSAEFTVALSFTNPLSGYNTYLKSIISSVPTNMWYQIDNFNNGSIYWEYGYPSAIFSDYYYYGRNISVNTPVTYSVNLDVSQRLNYYFSSSSSLTPQGYILGKLNGASSYDSQVMLPATSNTPQDISDTIYNTLLPDYPAIADIYFPAGGADVPDMSGFDFPPDLPAVSFNAPEMPSQSLPEGMLSGAGFWFTQFGNLLDGLGVKYIVIIIMIAVLLLSILKF